MKNSTLFLTGTIVLATTFFLSSCKKLQDYILSHPGATHPNCRIEKFYAASDVFPRTGTVFYNKYGNPDSVIFDDVSTGKPDFYMYYDKKNRLIDCMSRYHNIYGVDTTASEGYFEPNDIQVTFYWDKYGYDSKNRVVLDTTFTDLLWEPGNFHPITFQGTADLSVLPFIVSTFEYDAQDRVIKKTTVGVNAPWSVPMVTEYHYDANGNLVVAGRQYDNQISFLRTNKIWMLLSLDYSANNPYPAAMYNSNGLPTKFDLNLPPYQQPNFLYTYMGKSTIEYSCK